MTQQTALSPWWEEQGWENHPEAVSKTAKPNAAEPRLQFIWTAPLYHHSTDGLIGQQWGSYEAPPLVERLAEHRANREYHDGDSPVSYLGRYPGHERNWRRYLAREEGVAGPLRPREVPAQLADDDIPF